ncbi:hypothetical protein DPMN_042843 [Dreissena polymorpha]|uniref:Uncharacterized protein n=1 Tax=Dreissena polymorpha TaxID=45954 RepID=A0A9D4D1J0_DREPO|nr:hypothetical protein DPMN_042843 [Dreissena polymorpha]
MSRSENNELLPAPAVNGRLQRPSLKYRGIVGLTAVGRQGIGATKTLLWSPAVKKRSAT